MIRVVYFGTSPFAVPALEELLRARDRFDVAAAVTQPDKPAGRKGEPKASPVAVAARAHGATLLQPSSLKDPAFRSRLAELNADVFIVAAYGKIVPKALLEMPRLGALNLHGSLLPNYRGASPIQAAILEGETETGVTLMVMDEKVDHGPTLAETRAPIAPDDTHGSLERKLGEAAAALLMARIGAYAAGELKPKEQDHDKATFTSIIGREDGLVDWRAEDAARIERKARAFEPWPGIHAVWTRGGKALRLKLTSVRAVSRPAGVPPEPGLVYAEETGVPAVVAKDGAIALVEVQPEGKKPMSGAAFVNGYRDFPGSTLA